MGVIFFSTLLAVALGYGVRSKVRKNTERREKSTLPQPDFSGNGWPIPGAMPFDGGKVVLDGFEKIPEDEFLVPDDAFFASGVDFEGDVESELWEEEKVDTDEKGKAGLPEKEETVLSHNGDGKEPAESGISLREAIIAQAVLERKCR